MTTPSNLYAEQIFAEQPLQMWALDDETFYLSWINESARKLSTWTKTYTSQHSSIPIYTPADSNFESQYDYVPFSNSYENQIHIPSVVSPSLNQKNIRLESTSLNFFSSQIDPITGYLSVGFQMFSNDESIKDIRLGLKIGSSYTDLKSVKSIKFGDWHGVMEQITLQPTQNDSSVKVVIEIDFLESTSDVDLFINGIVVGQGAEYFGKTSLGVSYGTIPSNIYLPTLGGSDPGVEEQREGIEIKPYGLSTQTGYYMIYRDFELVSQSGIPMVYGSNTSTILNPVSSTLNMPNMILPAQGFLNELGKYRDMALEFWIKVNHKGTSDSSAYRVVGPLAGTDGLYIDESFMILKIGDVQKSYFVGEWGTPMLVSINISEDIATVLINGVTVISLDFITDATQFISHEANGMDQNWLGFFAPSEIVDTIEIDCIAIYPYLVNEILSKKRHGYGQAVDYPSKLNAAYGGTSVYPDFLKNGDIKNYIYPTTNKWEHGVSYNAQISGGAISMPQYPFPVIETSSSDKTVSYETFYTNNKAYAINQNIPVFSLYPDESSDTRCIRITDLSSKFSKQISGMHGVFSLKSEVLENHPVTILQVIDKSTQDRISIYVKNIGGIQKIVHSIYLNGDQEYDISSSTILDDNFDGTYKFATGIYIPDFVGACSEVTQDIYGNDISAITNSFMNSSLLEMTIGNDITLSSTAFNGNIYKISFISDEDVVRMIFDDSFYTGYSRFAYYGGIFDADQESQNDTNMIAAIVGFTSIYDMCPKLHGPTGYIFDIGSSMYWYDYTPLSRFSKTIYLNEEKTEQKEDVDFIQVNFKYPDNISSKVLKAYVSFEYPSMFSGQSYSDLVSVQRPDNNVIDVTSIDAWYGKKFEISNGAIVYVPKQHATNKPDDISGTFDFSQLLMFIRFESSVSSLSYQPVQISSLEMCSVSLNEGLENSINTRFATKIYPETIDANSGAITYKSKNPYRMTKHSLEYMNLTNNSGIEMADDTSTTSISGNRLSIKLNERSLPSKRISSVQIAFNHRGSYSETEELIFSIDSSDVSFKDILIYAKSVNSANSRAEIYAKINGQYYNGVKFYINGTETDSPVLKRGEWTILGITFAPAINISNISANFSIYSRVVVNNISYYNISEELINQYQVFKKWSEIEGVDYTWSNWLSDVDKAPNTWQSMLSTDNSTVVSIDATDIYKIFLGTNKILSDARSDSMVFAPYNYQYSVYNNIFSKTIVSKPV